ncbi:hypothetical protein CDL12_30354 [Handroanthus impetiginosus]|uniref:Uncharacterized protein n=1 Tax=Handroanthus impetiginosus TaxID=429701 RepID=A0A2G9FVS7_9LAMI|nr:hypothetical protein CDL12_30354 [Handroanthus impetiginosus]
MKHELEQFPKTKGRLRISYRTKIPYASLQAAPEYWRNLDPYWVGDGPPMRRYFHPDGTVTADPDDKAWGGHESAATIVTGSFADGKIREHYVRINRWPQLSVQRRPDWTWVLSNHLYIYTSIPDPHKPDGTGPFFPVF